MRSKGEFRWEILKLIEAHDTVDDQTLADKTGADKKEVQNQIDILEEEGLVTLNKTFGPIYTARIIPLGRLAIEQLTARDNSADKARIGFV